MLVALIIGTLFMSVFSDLSRLNAPKRVLEAGQKIDEATQAKISPPYELVLYVRDWVTRSRGNNRYGR